MHIQKDEVVELLRARGDHDRAASVECALPRHVDIEEDAGILHQFGVNVSDLAGSAGAPEDPDLPTAGAGSV